MIEIAQDRKHRDSSGPLKRTLEDKIKTEKSAEEAGRNQIESLRGFIDAEKRTRKTEEEVKDTWRQVREAEQKIEASRQHTLIGEQKSSQPREADRDREGRKAETTNLIDCEATVEHARNAVDHAKEALRHARDAEHLASPDARAAATKLAQQAERRVSLAEEALRVAIEARDQCRAAVEAAERARREEKN